MLLTNIYEYDSLDYFKIFLYHNKPNMPKSTKKISKCTQDKIINPDTGRCVSKKGKIGQKILGSTKPKPEKKKIEKPKKPVKSKKEHKVKSKKPVKSKKDSKPKPSPKHNSIGSIAELFDTIKSFPQSEKCQGNGRNIIRLLSYVYANLPHATFCLPHARILNSIDLRATVAIQFDDDAHIDKIYIAANLKNEILKCPETFVIISFGLFRYNGTDGGHHSNMIFIDKIHKTFERFEPHGEARCCNHYETDEYLKNIFGPAFLGSGYKYIAPLDVCPNLGPQRKQASNQENCHEGGYCAVFSTLYAHMRVLEPSMSPSNVLKKLLDLTPHQILDLIKRYTSYIDAIVPSNKVELKKFDEKYMQV